MDPEFSKRYRELYDKHWWFRAREKLIVEVLRCKQPAGGWKTILDVGCGDALFFRQLQQFGEVEGVEPVAAVIDPESEFRQRIHVGSFDQNFQPKKRYSLILMLDVLEHLDDPLAALRRAYVLLQPGGLLLITVPAFPMLWTSHDDLNHHRVRYTRSSLTSEAKSSGFKIVEARYFFFFLFLAKLAARIKEGLLGSTPAIPKIPSPALNRFLYRISRMEETLFGALPIPFGGSLLMMCQANSAFIASDQEEIAQAPALV